MGTKMGALKRKLGLKGKTKPGEMIGRMNKMKMEAYNTGTKAGNIAYLQAQAGRDVSRAKEMNKPMNIAKATIKGLPQATVQFGKNVGNAVKNIAQGRNLKGQRVGRGVRTGKKYIMNKMTKAQWEKSPADAKMDRNVKEDSAKDKALDKKGLAKANLKKKGCAMKVKKGKK